ncbi:MAG TPA: hypothetical protein PLS83_13290 [Methanothrix soehngenii]|nr:hypothetical protein [Methanothrix soehngenii]
MWGREVYQVRVRAGDVSARLQADLTGVLEVTTFPRIERVSSGRQSAIF